ncbi:MAG: ACP S-malonyltransferase [Acetivibrio ethanolgignens]
MNKTAFIFPGQGVQRAGMGKDFYENSQVAREIFEEASEVLSMDMKALCFEKNEQLDKTEFTQAALVTTCLAMLSAVKEAGFSADVTAGLSLGEYCAIVAAGGMSAREAIYAVRKRGIYMQEAVPAKEGAMAAILGMTAEEVEAGIQGIPDVYVANYNCPGQLVITGRTKAVKAAKEELLSRGAKRAVDLNVSGPFHSPLLEAAGEKLEKELSKLIFTKLTLPYVTNVTAEYVTEIGKTKEFLKKQVASGVRWQQSMEVMLKNGITTFIEIGPGQTLRGFLKKIAPEAKVINIGTWKELLYVKE